MWALNQSQRYWFINYYLWTRVHKETCALFSANRRREEAEMRQNRKGEVENRLLLEISPVLQHKMALALIEDLYRTGEINKETFKKAKEISKKRIDSEANLC